MAKRKVTIPDSDRPDPVELLRRAAEAVRQQDIAVMMPEPDPNLPDECPFVDEACEKIEHGGKLGATGLSSLISYIADMME